MGTLRLQHESRPDAIAKLDRQIMTIEIELESLRKEKTNFPRIEELSWRKIWKLRKKTLRS